MEDNLFDTTKTFSDFPLSPAILETLTKLNYANPTKIQSESLPYSLQSRDIIALAETGSGKTLAFALPIIQALIANPRPYYALILAPTRELCLQIQEHFNAIGAAVGLHSVVIVGGLDLVAQSVALVSKKPHVIIASPGRILHHLENTKGFNLSKLGCLVLDEADKLLSMNFEEALDKILALIPKERHTLLFSATMTNKVSKLQRACLQNPVKVEVSSSKHQTVQTLSAYYVFFPHKFKEEYAVHVLNQFIHKSIIVFAMTCKTVMKLTLLLRSLGFDAIPIHGQMTQVKRINSLSKFKSANKHILIATDVASRGLDIPHVDLVLNYDVPLNPKDYVHRVGRTARAGRFGTAITLVTQYDVEMYQKIEASIDKKLEEFKVSENEVMVYSEKVKEASRIADFELKKLLEKGEKKMIVDEEEEEEKKKNNRDKKIKKRGGEERSKRGGEETGKMRGSR